MFTKAHNFSPIICILLLSGQLIAQPEIDWSFTNGGRGLWSLAGIQVLPDGDYLFNGQSYHRGEFGDLSSGAWIMRVAPDGEIIWNNSTYGLVDGLSSFSNNTVPTEDSGFISGGYGRAENQPIDIFVFKIFDEGEQEWSNRYGQGDIREYCVEIESHPDGGYIILGGWQARGNTPYNLMIIRINEDGDVIWDRIFDQENPLILDPSALEIVDDNIYVTGSRDNQFVLLGIDNDGEILLNSSYGEFQAQRCTDYVQCRDGGFALFGIYLPRVGREIVDYNSILIRTDIDGQEIWSQTYDVDERGHGF